MDIEFGVMKEELILLITIVIVFIIIWWLRKTQKELDWRER